MLEREKKRKTLSFKYLIKRKFILNKFKTVQSLEEIFILNKYLQKFPKNSIIHRVKNRCWKTGKPRGFLRFFGLCRNAFRELALECLLPGITKSSW